MSAIQKKRALEVFKSGDEKYLWSVSKELFETGFFNCYLTPQQFNLLRVLLYIDGKNGDDNTLWRSFMNGSLILRFKEDAGDDSNSNDNMYMKPGYPTLRNLSATVRYLLYEKAIDYYFFNDSDDVKEFHLLENSVSTTQSTDILKTSYQQNGTIVNSEGTSNNREDSDYDMEGDDNNDREDDNYDDEDENEASEAVKGNLENQEAETLNQTEDNDKDGYIVDPSTHNPVLLVSKEELLKKPVYPSVPELSADDDAIGKMVHPILGTSSAIESSIEKQNELKLIKNFNKVYHHFENDLPNIHKKRKLERSDKQLEMEENTIPDKNESNDSDSKQVNKLITLGGAVNLSLKNLLNRIEENRDKVDATDVELKNLIMDVRKNRSKWANYNKIGQEELYEACEKVVTELRGFTEHSTPFLNRVSKREAPNYYQVIKKPMDLNTVFKKLKTLQYQNKKQFVDDLMLIWQNCLTYNSDPNHYIRVDALAMRKKTLMLIPLIPDITIRDRADVEREAAEKEKEREREDDANTTIVGRTSARGVGQKKAKKGRNVASEDFMDTVDSISTPMDDAASAGSTIPPVSNGTPAASTPAVDRLIAEESMNPSTGEDDEDDAMDIDEDDDNDDDNDDATNNINSNGTDINNEDLNEDADDLEISTWKSLTSTTRYKLCTERSKLFKDNKLQPNTEATIRTKSQMYNFSKYLEDDSKVILHRNRKYFDENDDPYLLEYDVTGGIPNIKHPDIDFDKVEDEMLEHMISSGKTLEDLPDSGLKVKLQGSNSLVLDNISLMQDIRKICFKINLIRTMQTSQFVHQSQFVAPTYPRIKFEDIDPMSKLTTRDLMTEKIASLALQKSVSAIAMSTGFQSTAPSCAVLLTQIAEIYLCNLAKTMKLHLESNSINKMPIKGHKPLTCKNVIQLVLEYNGVEKPDVLYSYYKEHLTKQNGKLLDLKFGLENFLRDLLRPSMQDISENQFNDDSEQFVNGDFSDEIGEDFFGFRELGLDKEFGLLTSNIPLHLLQSKLSYQFSQMNKHMAKRIYEDFEEVKFPKLRKKDIPKQIGILQPFYEDTYIKSKLMYNKQLKKYQTQIQSGEKPEEAFEPIEDEEELVLIEDTDLPHKQRNNRPKIPPNGKITQIKKKFAATAFFIEKQDEIEARLENMNKKKEADTVKGLERQAREENKGVDSNPTDVGDTKDTEMKDGDSGNDINPSITQSDNNGEQNKTQPVENDLEANKPKENIDVVGAQHVDNASENYEKHDNESGSGVGNGNQSGLIDNHVENINEKDSEKDDKKAVNEEVEETGSKFDITLNEKETGTEGSDNKKVPENESKVETTDNFEKEG